jgi:hypothetical protein
MNLVLEQYMDVENLPETKRSLLRKQAEHSFSCYGLNGEPMRHSLEKEDLLAVLMGMERYVIDSNLPGLVGDAKKPENRNKAIILGETFTDEAPNLEKAILRPLMDNLNNNLFDFGRDELNSVPFLKISRLDIHLRIVLDAARLRLESRERDKLREDKHMAAVMQFKVHILNNILHVPDLTCLPPVEFTERKKAMLIEIIRSKASGCFTNYANAVEIAELCYATLLLEPDEVGSKTRREFCEPNRRNVFGDTRLMQNTLWLKAQILSGDKAVRRMAAYINMPELTVTDKL